MYKNAHAAVRADPSLTKKPDRDIKPKRSVVVSYSSPPFLSDVQRTFVIFESVMFTYLLLLSNIDDDFSPRSLRLKEYLTES